MHRSSFFHRYLPLLAIFWLLTVATTAMAVTTGSIRGTALDEDGLPIPGVLVIISSENLIGGQQERESDAGGEFSFVELPPGAYELTAIKGGFTSVTYTGIVVQVGRTATQVVEMRYGGELDELVVEGTRNAVDVENTTRGEVLTKEFLQRIPAGRSYQSAVQQVAGVQGGVGGNPNMAGAAYNENTYMLDGATVTDPVTGTFSLNFNYDAIQQIEVLLGGFMPEYGQSLGGVVNLVTESGTNNLEFDTNVYYVNGDWRPRTDARYSADGFTIAPTDFGSTLSSLQLSTKLSGPIIRDRAWFILSYQATRSLRSNVGVSTPRDFDGHYVLTKLTVQPNSEHRITAFAQLNPTNIDNTYQSQFTLPEAQARQSQGGIVTQGRWQWFLSPDANVDTSVVFQKSYLEGGSVPCTHDRDLGYHPCKPFEPEGSEDWETPGRVGLSGAYDSINWGDFDFDDRLRFQASSKLSILSIDDPLGGVHDVKAGVQAVQTVWDRTVGYSGNTRYYDINEVRFDPSTFTNYYWIEITGPVKFRTSMSQWNVFVQDAWKPIPNLTVKGGVRYDNAVVRNDTGDPVITGSVLGPRLYAAWDPKGNQKTKISGGFGRFNDTGLLGTASYVSRSGFGSKLYLGELFANGEGQGFSNAQEQSYDVTPNQNYNTAHDKLQMPRSDEVTFLFQQELVQDVALGVNLTGKYTRYLYEPEEQNLIYDEDGSAVIGSRYGDQFLDIGRLRTPAIAMRDYYQADVYLDKVLARRWFARVTYTNSRSLGTSSQSLSGSFYNDPQTQYNYGNFLNTDIRHSVKGFASWTLPTDPWQQTLSLLVQYNSGFPMERRYYSEATQAYSLRIRDRSTYTRGNPIWFASIKFMQDIDVKKGKLILDLEVRNIFNNRSPSNYLTTLNSENRLFIADRQDALQFQLGARYRF